MSNPIQYSPGRHHTMPFGGVQISNYIVSHAIISSYQALASYVRNSLARPC